MSDIRETSLYPFGWSANWSNMTLERANYYEDHETDEEGNVLPRTFKAKVVVCDCCGGRGRCINPSIDSNGLTADDFAEDEDFAEGYFRGDYDIACPHCQGKNVVLEIDEDDEVGYALYCADVKEWSDHFAEVAAERRMGC